MTVHFVDEGVDTGPIVLQRAIELTYIAPCTSSKPQIHAVEHELLPQAIALIAAGVSGSTRQPAVGPRSRSMSAKPRSQPTGQRGGGPSRCGCAGR